MRKIRSFGISGRYVEETRTDHNHLPNCEDLGNQVWSNDKAREQYTITWTMFQGTARMQVDLAKEVARG